MRDLRCGLLDESFGCGGPTLAGELGQSQLSDVLQTPGVVCGFGVAVKLTMIGFGIWFTVTVAVAVTLPAPLVAVNV